MIYFGYPIMQKKNKSSQDAQIMRSTLLILEISSLYMFILLTSDICEATTCKHIMHVCILGQLVVSLDPNKQTDFTEVQSNIAFNCLGGGGERKYPQGWLQ